MAGNQFGSRLRKPPPRTQNGAHDRLRLADRTGQRRYLPLRVALALGSGGARGYAHIGVINELRDRGYQIVGIAGSSMGALVGGLQAAAGSTNSPTGQAR